MSLPSEVIVKISNLKPCPGGLSWLLRQKHTSLEDLWQNCLIPDWMVWLIVRTCGRSRSPDHRRAMELMFEISAELTRNPGSPYGLVNKRPLEEMIEVCKDFLDKITTRQYSSKRASVLETKINPVGHAHLTAKAIIDLGWAEDPSARIDSVFFPVITHLNQFGESATASLIRKHYPTPPEL